MVKSLIFEFHYLGFKLNFHSFFGVFFFFLIECSGQIKVEQLEIWQY